MAYHVELTTRASRNLRRIYRGINAVDSAQARVWFNGLEAAVFSLDECPVTPENRNLRDLLYGRKGHVYRIIYTIDEPRGVVTGLHIRHGSRRPLPREGEA